MPGSFFRAFIGAFLIVFAGQTLAAQSVGFVLDVTQGAIRENDGQRRALIRRDPVAPGDVILTDSTGVVQIVFNDRTRIAIGPDSEFVVEDVQIERNRAARFAVKAVTGTFRFLSGRSDKETYEIRTPTATMGIRGTVFDFAVMDGRATGLVTFRGQVHICGSQRRCALVSGGCAAVRTTEIGDLEQPASRADRDAMLLDRFPFVISQKNLRRRFRTRTSSCGTIVVPPPVQRIELIAPARAVVVNPPPPPAPEPPDPPDPPGPPDPPDSPGYPGQSGSRSSPGPSQGNGHVESRTAGGLGLGHGKENPNRGGRGNGRFSE